MAISRISTDKRSTSESKTEEQSATDFQLGGAAEKRGYMARR